jgi:hypothetical protein
LAPSNSPPEEARLILDRIVTAIKANEVAGYEGIQRQEKHLFVLLV